MKRKEREKENNNRKKEKEMKRSEKRTMRVLYIKLDVEVQVYYIYIWFFAFLLSFDNWMFIFFFFFLFRFRCSSYTPSALFQNRNYYKMYPDVPWMCVLISIWENTILCINLETTTHTQFRHIIWNKWMNEEKIRKTTPIRKQNWAENSTHRYARAEEYNHN